MSPEASHGAYSRVPVVPHAPILRDPRGEPVPPLNLRAAVQVAREQLSALREEARTSSDPGSFTVALALGRDALRDLLAQAERARAASTTAQERATSRKADPE